MKNIVLCGFMGCGKSTVGRLVAARSGRRFVDMDTYIETEAGRTISTIFAEDGEAAFRRMEHEACVALGEKTGLVIATGGGAVLREDNTAALKKNGTVVWLNIDPDTVLTRLAGDTTRPLLQRDDKDAAVRMLLSDRNPLYARAADAVIEADGDADAVAKAVLAVCDDD